MQIREDYFLASFYSFLLHGMIILYLMNFFYFEKNENKILSSPVNVNLVFQEQVTKNQKTQPNEIPKIEIKQENINKIELSQTLTNQITPIIQRTDINLSLIHI